MKSALEIAMQKTASIGEKAREELEKLSPEDREAIEKIKKKYEAKIAEKDVFFQQETTKINSSIPIGTPPEQIPPEISQALTQLREKFNEDRSSLEQECEKEINAIKNKNS
tara:strand:+ start:541 stop:873 length:333 start_codon:yes stop_codon:yes gene_type:complete